MRTFLFWYLGPDAIANDERVPRDPRRELPRLGRVEPVVSLPAMHKSVKKRKKWFRCPLSRHTHTNTQRESEAQGAQGSSKNCIESVSP